MRLLLPWGICVQNRRPSSRFLSNCSRTRRFDRRPLWPWKVLVPKQETAVPALTELFSDEDWKIQKTAAEALGSIGPDAKTAIPFLTGLLQDPNVRNAALDALYKIKKRNRVQKTIPDGSRHLYPQQD